jgi:hypothetical protein
MPSFKDSNNPALNPELAIKKEVMRRAKDANRRTEGVEIPTISQQIATPYGDFYKMLVGINAYFGEVGSELDLLRGSSKFEVSDRFKGSSLALTQSLKFANQYLKKIKYDLSGFSDDELRGIKKEYDEMIGNETTFVEGVRTQKGLADREEALDRPTASSGGDPEGLELDEEEFRQALAMQYGDLDELDAKQRKRAEAEINKAIKDFEKRKQSAKTRSEGQSKRYKSARYNALLSQFNSWLPEYKDFVKRLGDALNRTGRIVDVSPRTDSAFARDLVGNGYSGGLMPSHYAITTASLPRRFI